MILGLGLFTRLALAGSVFYIVHHIIVKTNLFLVSGVAARLGGSYELKQLGGLYRAYPLVAALFFIPAMSLAGMPPLSGFFAKLALVRAGLEVEQYLAVGVALAVGLFTLFSMTKIWGEAFWKDASEASIDAPATEAALPATANPSPAGLRVLLAPIVALALVTLWLGLWGEPMFRLALRAADQLLDPAAYVTAVLGEGS
jgi:multicomponent Na+:H+ antiporter subunit D